MSFSFSRPSRLCPLFLAVLALAPTAFAPHAFAPHAFAQSGAASRVETEILVRWNNQSVPRVLAPNQDPSRWQQQELGSSLSAKLPGARVARSFAGTGWSVVRLPPGVSAAAAKTRLAALLGGASVAFNGIRHATRTPNDPDYASQWQWPQIKAPDAWNLKTGSSDVVVAVLDTGIDLNHADLKANLWKNPKEIPGNGIDDDHNGYVDDVYGINTVEPKVAPQDDNGHGTHCAGLVGAVGNNGNGVTGVCWSVKLMSLKFLDYTGDGDDAHAIECLEYAVKMKQSGVNLRVVSNSWSGPDDNPALKSAFALAEKAGLLNVCAAGNETENTDATPEYPASYTLNSIISVAASDRNDAPAYFSNTGAKSVDLAAPGVSINSLKRGGGETVESGTSMSTPIVAGAAALVAARDGSLAAASIKERLIKTVDVIPAWKGKSVSGGRLNLSRALTYAVLKISGLVYRPNGTARTGLAGALLKLNTKTVGSSDKNGRYTLTDLAQGNYSLTASLSGYSFATVQVSLPRPSGESGAPNAVVDFGALSVPSTSYTISGRAFGADNQPKTNVSVFVQGTPTAVAITDSLGRYTLRDRAAGGYKLIASDGDSTWRSDPTSVSLPTSGKTGAPNGIVNFFASTPDREAPHITITAPANGATLLPGSTSATGTATDTVGTVKLYFQLTRVVGFDLSYYNWTTKTWTTNADETGAIGSQTVSGSSLNWSQLLPELGEGSYSLRVWGLDAIGNQSNGEADAVTSWMVKSSQSSARAASVKPSTRVD